MTPFGRWLEETVWANAHIRPKSDSNEAPMSAVKPAARARAHRRASSRLRGDRPLRLFRRRRDHLCLRQISRPVAGTRPAAGLHRRDDRQFHPQPVDHLPPLARAALPRLPSLLRRRLGRARGQLCRLFGLRCFGPPRRDRRHAGDPAAVRRRRQRGGDGSDLCRLSVLRLSAVRIVDSLAQSLLEPRYDRARSAVEAPLDVPFAL